MWERGVGISGEGGRPEHLEGFVSDITELRLAESALREREQMLSGLVEILPGAAYRSDLRDPWHMSFLSEGFRALLGHDPRTSSRAAAPGPTSSIPVTSADRRRARSRP